MPSVFIVLESEYGTDIIREVFSTKEKAIEYIQRYNQEKFDIIERVLDPDFTDKLQTQVLISEDGKVEDVQQYYYGWNKNHLYFEQHIVHKVPTWSGTQSEFQWYALFQLTESDKDKAVQFAKDCLTKIASADAWGDTSRANRICFEPPP